MGWRLPLALLLSVVFLVHAPSLDNEYVYDDRSSAMPEIHGQPHPMVAELQPLSEYFSSHYLRGANETSRGYRPVTVLSYALVYTLLGRSLEASATAAKDPKAKEVSALPQHLLNVLLQVLNTFLVWLLLMQVAGRAVRGWPALAAAAVFGLHAIHSGPVASIVGRGELLAFTFGAAAAVVYLAALRRGLIARIGLLVGCCLLLFLAFCSKESALAWACFLPCLRLARHWGHGSGETRPGTDLLLGVAVATPAVTLFLWLYFHFVYHLGYLPSYLSNPLLHELPGVEMPAVRWMTALMLWVYGLYKVLSPFSPCCNYSPNTFTLVQDLGDPRMIGAVLILVLVLGGALCVARRQPLLFLAMAAFLGFSFIISNVPFGLETIFAERLYYTPSLSLSFLVAWLLQTHGSWGAPTRRSLAVVVSAWLVASSWTTWYRMGVWQDNYTLFTHDAKVQPRSLSLLQIAAGEYASHEPPQHDEYLACVDQILRIEPRFVFGLKARARNLLARGDLDGAQEALENALKSDLLWIVDRANDVPEVNHDLGVVLLAKGRSEDAARYFHAALDFAPNYHPARQHLLRLALEDDDITGFEQLLKAGIAIDQEHDPWKIFLGVLCYRRGDYQKAARILDDILPRAPMEHARFSDWLALADSLGRAGQRDRGRYRLEQAIHMGGIPPEHAQAVAELRRRLQD